VSQRPFFRLEKRDLFHTFDGLDDIKDKQADALSIRWLLDEAKPYSIITYMLKLNGP
jgi:hypothetical protein